MFARNKLSPKLKKTPLDYFSELIWSEKSVIGIIFTYEIGIGILSLTIPIGVQTVVNTLAFSRLVQPIVFLGIALFVGQLAVLVIKTSQIIIIEKLQKRLFAFITLELSYRIPRLVDLSKTPRTDYVNRFFDIITIQKNLSFLVIEGFSFGMQMATGLILLAFYHPFLLVFNIILLLSFGFIIFVLGRGAIATSVKESTEKYNVANWLEQIASKNITFNNKSGRFFAIRQTNEFVDRYLEARDSHFKIVLRQIIGFLSLQAIINTSLLVLGVWLVSKNQLSIGQLVAAEIVISTILYSFLRFQKHLDNYYDLLAGLAKVGDLLDKPIESPISTSISGKSISGELQLKEIFYQYEESGKKIGPLNLKLEAGSKLAIVGSNGSGKSTLIKLLYGSLEPTSGSILYGSIDSRMISLEVIRESVALVKKDEIISGSILSNLTICSPEAKIEEVNSILLRLDLLDEFLRLPDGLSTLLSEGGYPLSNSVVMRLMIARAYLSEPKYLIIDDVIDSINGRSLEKVLDLIFAEDCKKTIVVASKNQSVVDRCDYILNLDSDFGVSK